MQVPSVWVSWIDPNKTRRRLRIISVDHREKTILVVINKKLELLPLTEVEFEEWGY